jgi:hypothetical protein
MDVELVYYFFNLDDTFHTVLSVAYSLRYFLAFGYLALPLWVHQPVPPQWHPSMEMAVWIHFRGLGGVAKLRI